jgi:hypothetical protein
MRLLKITRDLSNACEERQMLISAFATGLSAL